MLHVYVVGPCGAGKSELARIFNVPSVDDLAYERNPELAALKPWRWWYNREGSRKMALQWEDAQAKIFKEQLKDHCLIISHTGAYLSTELPEGITFLLEPHESESIQQRLHNQDWLEITRTSQMHWKQTQRQLCHDKAIKLGTVIHVPSFVRLIDVVRHIEYATLACMKQSKTLKTVGLDDVEGN